VTADGSIVISDTGGHSVKKIGHDGLLCTLVDGVDPDATLQGPRVKINGKPRYQEHAALHPFRIHVPRAHMLSIE
jgi:hypothetical protein